MEKEKEIHWVFFMVQEVMPLEIIVFDLMVYQLQEFIKKGVLLEG
jgi:hypothetical protein